MYCCMQYVQEWVKDMVGEWNKDYEQVLEELLREPKTLPGQPPDVLEELLREPKALPGQPPDVGEV